MAFALVLLHYVKRELETVYVHVFSLDTMPVRNIFKNSFHYWLIGGAMIAYFLYHPLYTDTKSDAFVTAAALLFVLAEAGNLYCHLILRWLRPAGSKARGIPRGFLFEYATCANYTCELAAWLVFAVFTQTLTAYIFLLVSGAQIAQWSVKKHVQLKREFGDKSAGQRRVGAGMHLVHSASSTDCPFGVCLPLLCCAAAALLRTAAALLLHRVPRRKILIPFVW